MGIALRAAALSLLLASAGHAAPVFTKVADASSQGMGWTPTVYFGAPAVDDGEVAFLANDPVYGIYVASGGSIATVVQENSTLLPGSSTRYFDFFSDPSISQGDVAFVANDVSYDPSNPGAILPPPVAVYRTSGGAISLVAGPTTPNPHGGGFRGFFFVPPDIQGPNVSFMAIDDSNLRGVFTSFGGALEVSADSSFRIGFLPVYVYPLSALDGAQVAYRAAVPNSLAIAVADGTDFRLVADSTTPVPGGTGTFVYFDHLVDMDGGTVVFQGYFNDDASGTGIYAEIAGVLVPITTSVLASALAIDGDVIAFLGSDGASTGLYAYHDGALERLIGESDTLDGKNILELRFGRHGLSGDQLAFTAVFEDGTQGVFLANIPEPGTGLLLAAGLALLASRRRTH